MLELLARGKAVLRRLHLLGLFVSEQLCCWFCPTCTVILKPAEGNAAQHVGREQKAHGMAFCGISDHISARFLVLASNNIQLVHREHCRDSEATGKESEIHIQKKSDSMQSASCRINFFKPAQLKINKVFTQHNDHIHTFVTRAANLYFYPVERGRGRCLYRA